MKTITLVDKAIEHPDEEPLFDIPPSPEPEVQQEPIEMVEEEEDELNDIYPVPYI